MELSTQINNTCSSRKSGIFKLVVIILIPFLPLACIRKVREKVFVNAVAAGDLKTVQSLLEKHPALANTIIHQKAGGLPVLCFAIQKGHTGIVRLLLSKGADPNVGTRSWGPLHLAASRGHVDMIRLLIQNGADVNGDNSSFPHCPLASAAFAKGPQAARLLIENGADVNFRNSEGAAPLHKMAAVGNVRAAGLLIANGAEVNASDKRGFTPLHRAAQECQTQFIAFLIENGATINARAKNGHTPLGYGIWWRTDTRAYPARPQFYEMLTLLISKGSHYKIDHVVRVPDLQRAADLLDRNPELINAKDPHGDPLLFCAIREGHPKAVDLLIKRSTRLDTTGKFGDPPLHAAAYAGNPETVRLLLQAGANVNKKGAHGELALHWVSKRGRRPAKNHDDSYIQVAKMLIDAGSDLEVPAEKPRPDMWCGIARPFDQIASQLRWLKAQNKPGQKYVPPWLAFNIGDTPLHSAARWGRPGLVGLLIEAGAKIDTKNEYGQTPLHYAIAFKHIEVVKYLLNAGADPTAKMNNGISALKLASKVKDQQIIKLLRAHR